MGFNDMRVQRNVIWAAELGSNDTSVPLAIGEDKNFDYRGGDPGPNQGTDMVSACPWSGGLISATRPLGAGPGLPRASSSRPTR